MSYQRLYDEASEGEEDGGALEGEDASDEEEEAHVPFGRRGDVGANIELNIEGLEEEDDDDDEDDSSEEGDEEEEEESSEEEEDEKPEPEPAPAIASKRARRR